MSCPPALMTQNWQVVPVGIPATRISNWVPQARAEYRTVAAARVTGLNPVTVTAPGPPGTDSRAACGHASSPKAAAIAAIKMAAAAVSHDRRRRTRATRLSRNPPQQSWQPCQAGQFLPASAAGHQMPIEHRTIRRG
jgi:hypothetical protein